MDTVVEERPRHLLQGILRIVDSIYAAACGETPWEQAVAEVCEVGKLDGCALSMIDRLERRRVVLAAYGRTCDPETNAMLGPAPSTELLTDSVCKSTLGAFWRDRSIMSETLPTTTLFRTDWMEPNGLASGACMIFAREEGQVGCFEVYAGAGRAPSCSVLDEFLRQLAPHLSRAWRLGMSRCAPLQHAATTVSVAPQLDSPGAGGPARGLDGLPEAARLRLEFGLTKAEARLALCLAKGWSLATAAEAFNIKLTTIRSQLRQVFSKTGTSRQAEFVAMLLSRGYGSRRPFGAPAEVTQTERAVA
jgi:DNA-binding CsgD family transcriptional regulator